MTPSTARAPAPAPTPRSTRPSSSVAPAPRPRLAALLAALLALACPPSQYTLPGADTDAPDPTCSNGQLDPGELAVDCGGACPPCATECARDDQCPAGRCVDGVCAPACDPGLACAAPPPCMVAAACPEGDAPCLYAPAADGTPCAPDRCALEAACLGGLCLPLLPTPCAHLDAPCQVGLCDPETGACLAAARPDGAPCADACGAPGECLAGACLTPAAPLLALADFADPEGWTSAWPWEIAPAKPSQCAEWGPDDPDDDHTLTGDQRLAGVVIGGCVGGMPAPPACLTSPPFKAPAELGPLTLRYWQVQDLPPGAIATVEAFDGARWHLLGPAAPEPDPNQLWSPVVVPLPPSDGALLQLRFCLLVPEPTPLFAGWSLDDLELLSGCVAP